MYVVAVRKKKLANIRSIQNIAKEILPVNFDVAVIPRKGAWIVSIWRDWVTNFDSNRISLHEYQLYMFG